MDPVARRLRLVRPSPALIRPAGERAQLRWLLAIGLGLLIGIAVPLLLGGCAPPVPVPTILQTDEERCAARGGYWTQVKGQWHCLARRP